MWPGKLGNEPPLSVFEEVQAWKPPVLLLVIHAVAHDKALAYLLADEIDMKPWRAPLPLKERTEPYGLRASCPEMLKQDPGGMAPVDDVFDYDHFAPLELSGYVAEDEDLVGGYVPHAVTRGLNKVYLVVYGELP